MLKLVRRQRGQAHCGIARSGATRITEDVLRNVIHGAKGALISLNDFVVVRAGKALLVCSKDRTQDVKKVVNRLPREGTTWT